MLNGLLDSLPAKVSIQGLPFDAVFTYAVYTLNYVIVKVRGTTQLSVVKGCSLLQCYCMPVRVGAPLLSLCMLNGRTVHD